MSAFPPAEDLVPHKGEMCLIDRIVGEEGETVRAEVTIRPDHLFFKQGHGVPAYVGFELMAQTISAYDGLRRRRSGKPPAIGFLLGCRRYAASRPFFREGETLAIEVTSLLGEDGMASFQCRITDAGGDDVASGVINVYRPADPEAFLSAER
ncbi:MAG: hypothetical protein WDM79_03320 [Terricaulis sp.]